MSQQLWGKGASLDGRIHKFTVGQDYLLDRRLAAYDAIASAAHGQMLLKQNILSAEECEEILRVLKDIYQESLYNKFNIEPEMEDCHTAIELRLVHEIGSAGKKIHTGRSRNDQVLVAVRLFIREQMIAHITALLKLAACICSKAEYEKSTPLPGYTHMQRAMPTTAGTQLLSYAQYVLSLVRDGIQLLNEINWCPLGVGSGFGVPFDVQREMTSDLLGFQRVQKNPIFVQSTRGREELKFLQWLIDIHSLVEMAAIDLLLYSTEEYGLITIPPEFTTGSSIMPQKRNPDVLELLRAQASRVRALRTELENVVMKLPSSYHRDYQYTKEPLFRATDITTEVILIFSAVIEGIVFSQERGREFFSPELFTTHYAYKLVGEGYAFRDAYLAAARALSAGEISVEMFVNDFLDSEQLQVEKELFELNEQLTESGNQLELYIQVERRVYERVFATTCNNSYDLG